jgi:hypothetical protein
MAREFDGSLLALCRGMGYSVLAGVRSIAGAGVIALAFGAAIAAVCAGLGLALWLALSAASWLAGAVTG